MYLLSILLTCAAVALAVCSAIVHFGGRRAVANIDFAAALTALAMSQMLHHTALWRPISLLAPAVVLLTLGLMELARARRNADDSASAVADV